MPHSTMLSVSLDVDISPNFTARFVIFGAVLKIMGLRVMGRDHLSFFFPKYSSTPYGSIILKNLEIKYKTVECTEKEIKCISECWQDYLTVST